MVIYGNKIFGGDRVYEYQTTVYTLYNGIKQCYLD